MSQTSLWQRGRGETYNAVDESSIGIRRSGSLRRIVSSVSPGERLAYTLVPMYCPKCLNNVLRLDIPTRQVSTR